MEARRPVDAEFTRRARADRVGVRLAVVCLREAAYGMRSPRESDNQLTRREKQDVFLAGPRDGFTPARKLTIGFPRSLAKCFEK